MCVPSSVRSPTGCRARQSAGSVQRPSRTCASYSCRKCFSVVSTGVTAASPNAHSVLPPMLFATLEQQVDVAHRPLAALDPVQDLQQPVGALAARRALAARLVAVEVQQVLGEPDHARRVVDHDDGRPTRASTRPSARPSKLACVSSWSGRRTGTDEPPGITAFSVAPVADRRRRSRRSARAA